MNSDLSDGEGSFVEDGADSDDYYLMTYTIMSDPDIKYTTFHEFMTSPYFLAIKPAWVIAGGVAGLFYFWALTYVVSVLGRPDVWNF